MQTRKGIIIPRTEFKAVATGLGSKIRLDKDNSLAFPFSFILDETLQLIETPRVEPSIEYLAHKSVSTLSYSFKVFQNNNISVLDNLFAYEMVGMPHIAFLPSRKQFKLSFTGFCAFALQPSPQILELHNLGLMTFENPAIRTNSKVVYSDINTHNIAVATRSRGVDVSGKSNMKKQFGFSIFDDFKHLVSPVKVFPIVFRNVYRNVFSLSWSKSSQPNFVKAECEKVSIETYRARFHNRFSLKFGGFKVFRSLCYGFTGKISRKPLPQILIDKMMQFKSVAYLGFKSLVNSILNSLKKSIAHSKKFFVVLNFQLYCSNGFHIVECRHRLYINFTHKCPVLMEVSVNSSPD